jgi:hypothetical protein
MKESGREGRVPNLHEPGLRFLLLILSSGSSF